MLKKYNVIGFDINKKRIEIYKSERDVTGEAGDEAVANTTMKFTSDETEIKNGDFVIVCSTNTN